MAVKGDTYKAVVEKVVEEGRHGPYAVARSGELVFTFSLNAPIWSEKDMPEQGTFVILSRTSRKRAGWRANKARFQKPSDG